MKKYGIALVLAAVIAAGMAFGQAFEDLAVNKHEGKTGLKDLSGDLDNNFAKIEQGTVVLTIGIGVTNPVGNSATNFFRVTGTTLVFVTQGFTNTIDADILH